MNTARIITSGSFGALPVILVTAITAMVKYKYTDAQIRYALAEQQEELQRLNEAQITELARILAEGTGQPLWKWFSIIRNAREVGLIDPPAQNGNGKPPPLSEDKPDNTMLLYVGIGLAGAFLILTLMKK